MYKDIEGYDGRYQVNELGDVRTRWLPGRRGKYNVDSEGWRHLPSHVMVTGYVAVNLRRPDKSGSDVRTLHRLVAETHLPNPAGLPNVLHRDGNKTNPNIENLYWGTASDNTYDMVRHGTHNNARKKYCKRGHALEGDNVRVSTYNGTTRRQCLPCKRIMDHAYGAKWRERRREEKAKRERR